MASFAIQGIGPTGRMRREHTTPHEAMATYMAWRQKGDIVKISIFLSDGDHDEAISQDDFIRLVDSEKKSADA
jgi:hypothetical protein